MSRAPVRELARREGGDAWRLALVAGADPAAALRAVLHAVVTAAVRGGEAAERPAVLALARSWARSSPGSGLAPGSRGRPAPDEDPGAGGPGGPVGSAFWSLPEPLRAALWCTDRLGLPPAAVERVTGVPARSAAVARGKVRRQAAAAWRAAERPSSCQAVAGVLARLVAGHAPARVAARARRHLAGCPGCGRLLAELRDPTAVVEAALPPAPDLADAAGQAWRDHVGAARRTPVVVGLRAATASGRRSRPLVAVLAVATAASFGAATSELAAAAARSVPPVPAAAGRPAASPQAAAAAGRPRTRPLPPIVHPQAVIPPLAPDLALDPVLARILSPELAEVTPPPPPRPPTPAAAPASTSSLLEPPPAVERTPEPDISIPLPLLPVAIDLACPALTVGPLHLALRCR